MNKKNCPHKNKSFLSLFLNLVLSVLSPTCFLSFMKKIVLFLFLFSSVSAMAFFSSNTQNNCALPLYMMALQSGMLDQQTQTGSSVASQKEAIRKKMTWYAEEAGRYKKAIGDLDDEIDENERRLSNDFGEGGDHVVDQIIDHITGEQSQEYGDENLCSDEEREKMNVYYREDKSSYFAKLSSILDPPPFSFALLHKIAQASLSQMIPSAVAKVVGESCVEGGDDVPYVQNGQNCTCKASNGQVVDCKDPESAAAAQTAADADAAAAKTAADAAAAQTAADADAAQTAADADAAAAQTAADADAAAAKTAADAAAAAAQTAADAAAAAAQTAADAAAAAAQTAADADAAAAQTAADAAAAAAQTAADADAAAAKTAADAAAAAAAKTAADADAAAAQTAADADAVAGKVDDKATLCDHWRRWRECAEDDGEIKKKKLCGSPGDCRYRGGTLPLVDVLKRSGKRDKCINSLDELAELIKKKKKHKADMKEMKDASGIAHDTLRQLNRAEAEGTASTTEATDCGPECRLRKLRELKEIVDPAPSGWDIFGNVVGTLGAAALGYAGVHQANKLRDAQGLGAQPGHALALAYPFIMKGLHGGGLFGGNSSSLACSPTANTTAGNNVFGNPFLAQQIQQQQQMHYMQQQQLMQAYYSSMPNMFNNVGNGINLGIPGGNNMFPQFPNIGAGINMGIPGMGNQFGNNMFPNIGAGINLGIPGMGNNMFPNIGAGINLGFNQQPAACMFNPTPACMMSGMGNMNNGMLGNNGGAAQLQYRQAMLMAHQTQMNNYMQREQAAADLMAEIARLEMQVWNIRNGGNMAGAGVNVNLGGSQSYNNNIGGGGNNTNTNTGTDDDMLDTSKMIRDF